jgi:HD-GYP domain-containing protein (c-di-GMP phosphodiesterase class II)
MIIFDFSGDIKSDVKSLFISANKQNTYDHSRDVAEMNIKIAEQYGLRKVGLFYGTN